jgi:acylphosphatase
MVEWFKGWDSGTLPGSKPPLTESLVGSGTRRTTRQVKHSTSLSHETTVNSNSTSKVEGEAQGDDDAIQTFLKDVDTGPPGSKVVKLDKENRDIVEGETGFEVRH